MVCRSISCCGRSWNHTLAEAKAATERSGGGKASNIIVAQGGRAFDLEFLGSERRYHQIENEAYAHTNHYLHCANAPDVDEDEQVNSLTRYNKAVHKLKGLSEFSMDEMTAILSDRSMGDDSILAGYSLDTQFAMGACGTLATVVMDLESRVMRVRRGNPASVAFAIDDFEEYRLVGD